VSAAEQVLRNTDYGLSARPRLPGAQGLRSAGSSRAGDDSFPGGAQCVPAPYGAYDMPFQGHTPGTAG